MTVKTTCCYCGVGCGLLVFRSASGRLSVEGDPDHPSSRGLLCAKGRTLHITAMDQTDRLEHPLMRSGRGAPLVRVTWDEALDRIAAVFKALKAKFGPDSLGFYGSGQLLTEEYYVLNKLVKGFVGTNNLDTNSRLCMSSAVAAYKMALGEDLVPVCYDDLELADCWYVAGANPAWCHPVLFRRIEAAKAARPGAKLIVADPRRTDTAAVADLHLALRPGTDIVLNKALARLLIEGGAWNQGWVGAHTEGFDAFRDDVFGVSVSDAAAVCGLPEADLRKAADWMGQAEGFLTLWAMGYNQSSVGVAKNLSLIHLNLLRGKIGQPGSGPFSLTGQPNAMGGREVGGMANLASAHRDLANPAHRAEIARAWGVADVPSAPGLTATEFFPALADGRLKALWVACSDPLVSQPDARTVEEAVRRAPFLVVQDMSSANRLIEYADVVLPAATWLEKSGTMTNSERRVSLLSRLIDPSGEALPDAEIFRRFAAKMGWEFAFSSGPEAVFDEHAALTRGTRVDVSGLSHARLASEGSFQWPVPSASSRGTPRLFADGVFATPSGRARFTVVASENTSEAVSAEFPLVLTTGRVRDQWHTMSRSGKVNRLGQHAPSPFLEVHPDDARRFGLEHGRPAVVTGRRGTVRVDAKVTDDVRPGVVFLPMHWGKRFGQDLERANNVTHRWLDPQSKQPDLKFAAVRVEAWRKPPQRVLVIGAGSGAARFVEQYRKRFPHDPVTVFSRESTAFYNRVLLPEWISGRRGWTDLVKLDAAACRDLALDVRSGVGVAKIDRVRKTVADDGGAVHPWDVLVLATGSHAVLPPGTAPRPGQYTLRTRQDAERLAEVGAGDPVVIVGGGVLGLELADALNLKGCRVTLVHRGQRLMDRLLDGEAAGILANEVRARGIDLLLGDEVRSVPGEGPVERVRLASGSWKPCRALVWAVGTAPNVLLAQQAGLQTSRGVVVDEYLRTSDPSIFAVGEVAEFRGRTWGLSAAAEEQADALVAFLSGSLSRPYTGSLNVSLLKVEGLNLVSVGQVDAQDGRDGFEVVTVLDTSAGYYKKCVVKNDRLVGALFVGDKVEFPLYKGWIDEGTELSEARQTLLRTGGPARKAPQGRIVCSCAQVGVDDLAEEGAGTLAGTFCGSCRPELGRLGVTR